MTSPRQIQSFTLVSRPETYFSQRTQEVKLQLYKDQIKTWIHAYQGQITGWYRTPTKSKRSFITQKNRSLIPQLRVDFQQWHTRWDVQPGKNDGEREGNHRFCGLFSSRVVLKSLAGTEMRNRGRFEFGGAMMQGFENILVEAVNLGFQVADAGIKHVFLSFVEITISDKIHHGPMYKVIPNSFESLI